MTKETGGKSKKEGVHRVVTLIIAIEAFKNKDTATIERFRIRTSESILKLEDSLKGAEKRGATEEADVIAKKIATIYLDLISLAQVTNEPAAFYAQRALDFDPKNPAVIEVATTILQKEVGHRH